MAASLSESRDSIEYPEFKHLQEPRAITLERRNTIGETQEGYRPNCSPEKQFQSRIRDNTKTITTQASQVEYQVDISAAAALAQEDLRNNAQREYPKNVRGFC
jgi:hypothetical protein